MTELDRDKLKKERAEIEKRVKGPFVSPADMRRLEEIRSLLLTCGKSSQVRLKAGPIRKSRRVTNFTRDRR